MRILRINYESFDYITLLEKKGKYLGLEMEDTLLVWFGLVLFKCCTVQCIIMETRKMMGIMMALATRKGMETGKLLLLVHICNLHALLLFTFANQSTCFIPF